MSCVGVVRLAAMSCFALLLLSFFLFCVSPTVRLAGRAGPACASTRVLLLMFRAGRPAKKTMETRTKKKARVVSHASVDSLPLTRTLFARARARRWRSVGGYELRRARACGGGGARDDDVWRLL